MVEMEVEGIRTCPVHHKPVLVLREKGGRRYLPILMGQSEAGAISAALQRARTPRPLTHDLLTTIVGQLGGQVRYALIHNFAAEVFHALVALEAGGHWLEVDCRPSDAIALALRCRVLIYAAEGVLAARGMSPPEDKLGEQERQRLAAFREFINTLDLEGLGSG